MSSRRATDCPDCSDSFAPPGFVDVMQPSTNADGQPAAHHRPCETCNPARHAVWLASKPGTTSRLSEGCDEDGYPLRWRGPRVSNPPLPRDRGGVNELPPYDPRFPEMIREMIEFLSGATVVPE